MTSSDNDMPRSPSRQLTLESGRGQQSTPESASDSMCNTYLVRLGWIWAQLQLVFTSWFDLALVIVPVAWIANFTPVPSYIAFPLNLIAIIPLAKVTSNLTEELAEQSNPWTAALWNVSLGNIVEIFIAVLSVCSDDAQVAVQSLLGSIGTNLTFVLSWSLFIAGCRHVSLGFSQDSTMNMTQLLLFASLTLSLPTVFQLAVPVSSSNGQAANLVHGIAIVVPCLYVVFLVYTIMKQRNENAGASQEDSVMPTERNETSSNTPFVNYWFAVGVLVITAGVTGLSSECMVQSLNKLMAPSRAESKTWIGLILLPVAGNAPEHATAVVAAWKGNLDLSIDVAVGSSLQIAACVLPFILLLIWRLGKEGGNFALVEILILDIIVFVTHLLLQQGKNNWFKGIFLFACFCVFSLIAVAT